MPSMRGMGPACCCCPDFWVLSRFALASGWRKLNNTGTYPDNVVEIKSDPVNTPQSTDLLAFDYRNKKIYTHALDLPSPDITIVEYSADMGSRREVRRDTLTQFGAPFAMGLAVDYENGKVFYGRWLKYQDPTLNSYEAEIRRCDLDGTNDTQITTEAWTTGSVIPGAIANFCWEPTQNALYYSHGRAGNTLAYIKRINADGTGKTTLLTLTGGGGNTYQIRGLGVVPSTEQVFWWEWFSTGMATTQTLKTGDFDCAGASTILTGDSDRQYYLCKPCQKDGRIYFESHPSADAATVSLESIELNGDNQRTEFDNMQDGWDGYRTTSGFIIEAAFGCKRETTGASYIGSGYASG